jgi:hypothetical protein
MKFGASISCSSEARDWLKSYTKVHKLGNYTAALERLRTIVEKYDNDEPRAADDVKEVGVAGQHMFSFAWFGDEPKAREYYSGLPASAFDWLHAELMPEVSYSDGAALYFFVVFPFAARACPSPLDESLVANTY